MYLHKYLCFACVPKLSTYFQQLLLKVKIFKRAKMYLVPLNAVYFFSKESNTSII